MSKRKELSPAVRLAVFDTTDGHCYYCGICLKCFPGSILGRDVIAVRGRSDLTMVVDHGQPLVRGGSNGRGNLFPSCESCNAAKGYLTALEFWFINALRRRDLSFQFPGDRTAEVKRDWLCVYSDGEERELLLHNFPEARKAYSRSRPMAKRHTLASRYAARL